MSLSGLAIAVGMIVDGTIVVVENVFRRLNENPDAGRLKLVAHSSAEVARPVFFALVIIMAVFTPLLTLTGLAGQLYTPLAKNIVFVMLGSLAVALGLIPVLAYRFLQPVKQTQSPLIRLAKAFHTPMLRFCLNHARAMVFITASLFGLSVWFPAHQGREFMPRLNEESIMFRVIAIPGTSLNRSIQNAREIERYILKKYSDTVEHTLSMIGRSEKGETAQANYMELLFTLHDHVNDIAGLSRRITADLQKRFAYLQFVPTQPIAMRIEELLEGIQAELAVKIYGEDQKQLEKSAGEIKKALHNIAGLKHITLIAVILLLYIAFGSLKKALLVISAVPLGLVGGITALILSGQYLSVSALIGFITVFAIALLNGIVLVSFIEELRKRSEDETLKALLTRAAALRLRPVLMTAFTTLLGILPLLWAAGVGSEVQYPLAVVVSGGIVSSTFLTLLALPALYLVFHSSGKQR